MKSSLLTLLSYNVLFLQWLNILSRGSVASAVSPFSAVTRVIQHRDRVRRADAATINTIRNRRISDIIGSLDTSGADISAWLSSLGPDGKWPDSEVDYTTGCAARRANWPAQAHWLRILSMAGAWHGGLKAGGVSQFVKDETLRAAISRAMDYWYRRDFTNPACLSQGGTPSCPCSNPGNLLWNTNWFSNVILIPRLVGQASLIMGDTLSTFQVNHCVSMESRSYAYNRGSLTGSNALDVVRIGMDQGLLTRNSALLTDAYQRSHNELVIKNSVRADGIRADGAFGQHDGVIYNGNYGKDFSKVILPNELEAAGTEFSANTASRAAFRALFNGNRWMIFSNSLTGVLHWDFSVIGRFITFPAADAQASASILTNLSAVGALGRQWQDQSLIDYEQNLSKKSSNANAGNLQGNRMFYTNDYMVHRGSNYVSTLKMWSTRSRDSECINSQNPFSFHLTDGATYNYIQGNEYEDVFAAWDWNLIPGITVDYGNTPLNCGNSFLLGVEAFVGGASDGNIGIAVMRYTNPVTRSLHWQKTWFYLNDDIQHVKVSDLSSNSGAQVRSVLDQRRANGKIFIDGLETQPRNCVGCKTLWHGNVGYKFHTANVSLTVQRQQKTGDWTKIGTSTRPPVTVDMFTAYLVHQSLRWVSYSVFPGTDPNTFNTKAAGLRLQSVRNDAHVVAIYHGNRNTFMAAFWDVSGGSATFKPDPSFAAITMSVDGNAAVIYKLESGQVTVSDPSQTLSTIHVTLSSGPGTTFPLWRGSHTQTLTFSLPQGGQAGRSVTKTTQA